MPHYYMEYLYGPVLIKPLKVAVVIVINLTQSELSEILRMRHATWVEWN
jgi:hypothetical protein